MYYINELWVKLITYQMLCRGSQSAKYYKKKKWHIFSCIFYHVTVYNISNMITFLRKHKTVH